MHTKITSNILRKNSCPPKTQHLRYLSEPLALTSENKDKKLGFRKEADSLFNNLRKFETAFLTIY